MARLFAPDPLGAAIRAEMRQLGVGTRKVHSGWVLGIVAAADLASTILTLSVL